MLVSKQKDIVEMNYSVGKAHEYFGEYFDFWLKWYSENGTMYIDDDLCIFALMTTRAEIENANGDNKYNFVVDKPDTWYVHYAAGDMKRIFEICPCDLQWAAFERNDNNKLKFYKLDKIRRRINGRR